MKIHFFNTLTGKKEKFNTLNEGKVKMYCCGVTPYGNTHIGHSRTFFSYDLLYRTLVDNEMNVEWARNITDVDDKIIKEAEKQNQIIEFINNKHINIALLTDCTDCGSL